MFTLQVLTVKIPQSTMVEQAVSARPMVHSVCVSPPTVKGNTQGCPSSGPPTVSQDPASRGHEVTEQSPQLLKTTLPAGSTSVAHQWAPFKESCLKMEKLTSKTSSNPIPFCLIVNHLVHS